MRSFKAAVYMALLVIFAVLPVMGQEATKNKYQVIEIMQFDVQQGVDFPPDYMTSMMEDLNTQLQKMGKFKQVLRQGENPTEAEAPALRLTGTVTKFKKGSRAKRYLIAPGVGSTKVTAHVKFLDRKTGETLLEKDVDGKVVMGGLVKGESIGATRGLAKEVVKVAKQKFF